MGDIEKLRERMDYLSGRLCQLDEIISYLNEKRDKLDLERDIVFNQIMDLEEERLVKGTLDVANNVSTPESKISRNS